MRKDLSLAVRALAEPTLISARAQLRQGRLAAAEQAAAQVLCGEPNNPIGHWLMGEIALRRQDFARAESHFLQATTGHPGYLEALHGLGFARYSLMRLTAALESVDRMLALDPTNLPARLLRAAIAAQCGDHEAALLLYRGIVGERPELVPAWLGLGHSERILGGVPAAIAAYREALRIDPRCGEAWGHLANIKTFAFTSADLRAMESLAARTDLPDHQRIFVHFALGKARYDSGDDTLAFRHYAEGNALARRAASANAAHDAPWRAAWIDLQLATLPAAPAGSSPRGTAEPRPIFIVGLPRSGTTLIEQILGSHPEVEATSELPYMTALAARLAQDGAGLAQLDRQALRREYLELVAAHRHTDRPCFVDKMPGNFAHVPLIRTLFPEAGIVDVRRHPLASCVSVFRQHLIGAPEYAGTLGDIAEVRRCYAATMDRFDVALPGAVHRLHYERLVENTEAEVARLLAHLGLPFDSACLRWYDGDQAVRTPSAEQVRQPIYRAGLDAWRRFESELDEARQVLSAEIAAYGGISRVS